MADEQGAVASAEATPAPTAPAVDYDALTAELTRQAQRADAAERAAREAYREAGGRAADLRWLELERNAPDPIINPDEAYQYWKRNSLGFAQEAYQAKLEAEEQVQQVKADSARQNTTDRWIEAEIAKFNARTGLNITSKDRRLIKLEGVRWTLGERAFKQSLELIEEAATSKRQALIEAGGGQFDGGQPSGGATQRNGFSIAQISDPDFYAKNRDAILADLDQRGVFADRRRRARAS